MIPTVMLFKWAAQPWFDTSVKIRVLCFSVCKGQPIFNFFYFSTTKDAFSEDLKQESSDLVTGDIASLFLGTIGKDACVTDPLGMSFSRDASTPIRDTSNLGVVCEISHVLNKFF